MYCMKILIIHWIQIKIVHGPSYIVGFAFYFNSSKWTRSFKESSTRYLVYFDLWPWNYGFLNPVLLPPPPIYQKLPPITHTRALQTLSPPQIHAPQKNLKDVPLCTCTCTGIYKREILELHFLINKEESFHFFLNLNKYCYFCRCSYRKCLGNLGKARQWLG